jgi:pimeloyl-ACP methyl ester carboxylesterase
MLIVAGSMLPGRRLSAELGASFRSIWSAGRALGVAAARQRWLEHELFASIRARPDLSMRFTKIVSDYSGWEWANSDPQRDLEPPPAQRLGELRARTLAIVGERDLADFQAIARQIEHAVPGARRVVLPGAGHMVNMEAPDRFNQLVIDFLAEPV